MANRAAQIRAENAGKAVTRRGRSFIEFDAGGGKRRFVATIEPLHAKGGAEIDTEWTATASPWSYACASADYASRIKAAFNGAPLVEFRAGDAWVTLQPRQLNWTNDRGDVQMISAAQAVTASLSDATARWAGAFGAGRDFAYTNHPKRLIKELLLDALPSTPSAQVLDGGNPVLQLQFRFAWDGATPYVDGAAWDAKTERTTAQRIEFITAAGPVFTLDAPTAMDANGDAATGVLLRVKKSGGSLYVEVRVPYAWLASAVYPVVVDPTLTLQPDGDAGIDTFLNKYSTSRDSIYGTQVSLDLVGSTNQRRSLLKFNLAALAGVTISSATLSFWIYEAKGWGTSALKCHRILAANSGWTEAGATWNHAVHDTVHWAGDADSDGGDDAGCTVSGTDYAAAAMATGSVGTDAVGTQFDLTLDTTEFASMVAANYGLVLFDTGNPDSYSFDSSDGSTAGERPKLVVEYTEAGGGGNPWYAYAQM